jgi:hypothetical protein
MNKGYLSIQKAEKRCRDSAAKVLRVFRHSVATRRSSACIAKRQTKDGGARKHERTDSRAKLMLCGVVLATLRGPHVPEKEPDSSPAMV